MESSQNHRAAAVAWLLAGLLFAATAALFWPATGYGFVGLDDEVYVADNSMTRDGFSAESLQWAFSANVLGYRAPVLWISYMLDGTLFGPNAWGFHFTNIFLHACNAVLFFWLLLAWTGRRWAALWGAIFWAWHPLRVESVAWITERKDVLSGLFFLLCLLAYFRAHRGGGVSRGWVWVSAGVLALGLLAKPVLVTVPFVLLLLDAWPLGRFRWEWVDLRKRLPDLVIEKWMFWLLVLGLGGLAWRANVMAGMTHAQVPPLMDRLLLVPGNYLTYLRQLVWPGRLAVLLPRPEFTLDRFALALSIGAGLTAVAWSLSRRWGAVLTGWLWFLGMLVPSIGLIWVGTTEGLGDRFSYLPAMGLSVAVAGGIPQQLRFERSLLVAGVLTGVACGWATLRQLPVWQHDGALFGRVLERMPLHLQANLNYGLWLWRQGREEEAGHHYRRAWAVSATTRPEVMGEAAYEWVLQGQARQAMDFLAPALEDVRSTPLMAGAYGMACLHEGKWSSAIWHLQRALELNPQAAEFRVELTRGLFESGEDEKARAQAAQYAQWLGGEIRSAEDLFPYYLQRWRDGARPYAWGYFRRLAAMQPESAALLNNLAWLAATDEDAPPEAVAEATGLAARAARLANEETRAALLDTLAAAQAAMGDFSSALGTAQQARDLARQEGRDELAQKIERRLGAYRRQHPWRE